MPQQFQNGYLEKFSKQVQKTLGAEFISLYQYGEDSDSLLLVLKSASYEVLALQKKIHQEFQKPNLFYHMMTLDELKNSHDVFPIEFLEMKQHRILLSGDDVLEAIVVDLKHVRHECEFYLRSNLMKLREGYLQPKCQVSGLIRDSLPSFLSVFKAFHICHNQPFPKDKKDVITSLGQTLTFNADVFEAVFNAHPTQNIDHLFEAYLETLTQIATKIDVF